MRKRMRILVSALFCMVLLSGCGCQHEWTEATCTAPKTCSKCGETEAEALGHSWTDATCTDPKTCTACRETEGEALGHSWQDATCTTPKTCKVCGEAESGQSGHAFADWSFSGENAMVRSCGNCGIEESCTMEEYLQEHLAGHWDAVSVANMNRRSDDDPYWKDVRYYYSDGDIPYMKISEDGSHEMLAGNVHKTDCRLEFDAVSQVKIPPSEEMTDAYYFILRSEDGTGSLFFYVPRESAVFLMGFIRMERADSVME